MTPAFNVLFLCTHNSARSIMAEAILEKLGKGRFNAYSAGSEPARQPMPEVIDRLQRSATTSRGCAASPGTNSPGPDAPRMDFVIALCDTPHGQVCPDFGDKCRSPAPGRCPTRRNSPAVAIERATLLNELYASLRRRIEIFTSLPFATLDRMALKARLDEIGDSRAHCAAEGALIMRVGINGMGRIGRLALRAAMGGMYRADGRSARGQPARCRPCQRAQGRRGGDRASARIRQHPWPLARALRRRGRPRDPHRQPAHRLQRRGDARRRRRGAISAATSCSNAPASS